MRFLKYSPLLVLFCAISSPAHSDYDSCSYSSSSSSSYTNNCTTDQAGTVATSSTSLSTSVKATTSLIAGRIGNLRSGSSGGSGATETALLFDQSTGAAAGNGASDLAVWANVGWTGLEDDNSATETDGDMWTGLLGADMALNDRLIVGAALLGEGSSLETTYNGGKVTSHSFGINPYASYMINDVFSVTAMSGVGWSWGDTERLSGGQQVTGEFSATRYFLSGSADANIPSGNFNLNAAMGLTWSQQFTGSYTESNGTNVDDQTTSSGVYHIQAIPSYAFAVDANQGFFLEPYALGRYDYEFAKDKISVGTGQAAHANARHGFTIGGGVNIYANDNLSFNLEGTHLMKDKENATTISASGRIRF